MEATRRTARWAGIWFILTFLTSIPAALLYTDVLEDPNYVVGSGSDTAIRLGALLEIGLAISGIATAVVLFPVLKRVSESISLGYVATRVIESAMILVGAMSLLAVITLQEDFAAATGADAGLYVGLGKSLVALHDWTFLFGPAFCAGLGNGVLLGYLMYRSELVPRPMAILGMVAGSLALVTAVAVLFGAWEQGSGPAILLTILEIVWEAFLGIYLTFWGFRTSSRLLRGDGEPAAVT
jgi:hypothetical protein